jgi:hypothetical protein
MTSSEDVKVKDILFPIIPDGAIPRVGCDSTIYLIAGIVETINAGVSLV